MLRDLKKRLLRDPSVELRRQPSQAGQREDVSPDELRDRERRNKLRRRSRRAKATLSIAMALAAGTFLACQSLFERDEEPEEEPNRQVPMEPIPPAEPEPPPEPPEEPPPPEEPTAMEVAPPENTEMVRRRGKMRLPVIDRNQHRTGMPVPDNLLE